MMEEARAADVLGRAKKIKMIILDVDGVLTDGGVHIGEEGELFKTFNIKDGMGIALWQRAGFKTAIITGRRSKML
ncbi:MAG: 3-deoxy-D-manno-octulosonate 8-phosphate phosphatase, partial [Schwartzia sp.]|nr:3-deoxy-D-manno-octulosonate 8-phosphate phosphatase [Schwartzia sp. (in: firmicutes)]